MTDPRERPDDDAELEPEVVKDLDVDEEESDKVRGGKTRNCAGQ
jgi:hypothetical protein